MSIKINGGILTFEANSAESPPVAAIDIDPDNVRNYKPSAISYELVAQEDEYKNDGGGKGAFVSAPGLSVNSEFGFLPLAVALSYFFFWILFVRF